MCVFVDSDAVWQRDRGILWCVARGYEKDFGGLPKWKMEVCFGKQKLEELVMEKKIVFLMLAVTLMLGYSAQGQLFFDDFESIEGSVLDVGCGQGRDALFIA